jgi:hypothetical protein
MQRIVRLTDSLGPATRKIEQASFLCVPAAEWHHHEYFPIKNVSRCLVVYELQPQKVQAKVSTVDQFGLNQLTIDSLDRLVVSGEIASN